jgi:predicted nuclease of predicted toxin-antitoxin system
VTNFKTGENLPVEAAALLKQHGIDAATVLDQKLGGRPDSDVAAVCKSEGRAVLTLDLDFANIDAYPPAEYPGIVVLRLARQDKAEVLRVLASLVPHLVGVDLSGRLWIVEATRIRERT